MKEHPNDLRYEGLKRRVEMVYRDNINTTFVKEYIYDPEIEDEVDREINHYDICMYVGKPDMEKTKSRYRTVKTILWNESIEGVEYIEWKPPEPYKLIWEDELDELPDDEDSVPDFSKTKALTAAEAVRRHLCTLSDEDYRHNCNLRELRELKKRINETDE